MGLSEISIAVGLVLSVVASITTIIKQRSERRKDDADVDLSKGRDTIADRDQLIDQIQEERKSEREDRHWRMDKQDLRIQALQEAQEKLSGEVDHWRTSYWRAIAYLRAMKSWTDRYMPADIPPAPEIPTDINSDI